MNLAELIEPHPADRVALWSRGRPTTYGELRAQVAGFRGALARLGVGRGDRVAMLCANNRYFVTTYLASVGLGAIAVPLNPTSPSAEVSREVAAVGAKVVVVGPMARQSWASVDLASVPTVEAVVGTDGHQIPGALTFEALLDDEPAPIASVDPDELAVLMFTSGTVGHPRAAMLTHGNLVSNLEQATSRSGEVGPDDVVFGVLPLFHVFGLNVVLGLVLKVGATVVLVQRFDPATALDTIRDRGCTVVLGAPPMFSAWAAFSEADPGAFAGVRLCLTGAAKMPEDHTAAFEARFGVELLEGYGLTEAGPVVTSPVGLPHRIGSIGAPLAGVDVRVVEPDGTDALRGDAGELWVRGSNVFAGYWNDPDATARALTPDGWLRTGDVAVWGDDGQLQIVDRVKDLVIVSGFNVYPAEVEEVLAEHPSVAEVAVVGVPHPHTGEAVKAYVVLEPGASVDEDSLIDWCNDHLARYKCPSKVLFVDELPKGMTGKLLRRVLR